MRIYWCKCWHFVRNPAIHHGNRHRTLYLLFAYSKRIVISSWELPTREVKVSLLQHLQGLLKKGIPGQVFWCLYFLEKRPLEKRNCQCPYELWVVFFMFLLQKRNCLTDSFKTFPPAELGPIVSHFTGTFSSLTRVGCSCMETFIAKSGLKCHCAFAFINCLYMVIIILFTVTQHWALAIYVQQITAVGERFGLFPLLSDNWGFT